MEAAEAAQVEELARRREENGKLEGKLSHHERLKTLANNNVMLKGKVTTLEAKARVTEERLKEMELARDADVGQAAEETMAEFIWSEEFATLLKAERDAGYA